LGEKSALAGRQTNTCALMQINHILFSNELRRFAAWHMVARDDLSHQAHRHYR
jgi:hypothetical protein